jgi:hypothetical protein
VSVDDTTYRAVLDFIKANIEKASRGLPWPGIKQQKLLSLLCRRAKGSKASEYAPVDYNDTFEKRCSNNQAIGHSVGATVRATSSNSIPRQQLLQRQI